MCDFLGLPAALAANNFAHQCLLAPSVLATDPGDPQTRQTQRLISSCLGEKRLRILDFGAGRGRLVSSIRESGESAPKLVQQVDYLAFDTSGTYRTECEAAIARLYGDSTNRYFPNERDVRAKLDANSVDIIVMCNVLHEIDPLEWPSLFGEAGMLRHLLNPGGFLLLVEDTEMRIGEKAHARGFLVMDTAELKTLFSIQEKDTQFSVDDARGDGRLKAHLIPAACVARITQNSLRTAVAQSRHFAIEAIKQLRASHGMLSYRDGRKHAYYVQQLANSHLALELLGQ